MAIFCRDSCGDEYLVSAILSGNSWRRYSLRQFFAANLAATSIWWQLFFATIFRGGYFAAILGGNYSMICAGTAFGQARQGFWVADLV